MAEACWLEGQRRIARGIVIISRRASRASSAPGSRRRARGAIPRRTSPHPDPLYSPSEQLKLAPPKCF
jgi:hypothetical protein